VSESAFERVKLARDNKRPTGLDYIKNIFKGFIEFHGDRRYADDPAIVGGIAKLDSTPVTVIAIEKGHTAKERTYRNFGMGFVNTDFSYLDVEVTSAPFTGPEIYIDNWRVVPCKSVVISDYPEDEETAE